MDLVFKTKTTEISAIEDRLKNLSLAYSVVADTNASTPSLVDGSQTYKGIKAMSEYIDLLDKEKGQWYYCNC